MFLPQLKLLEKNLDRGYQRSRADNSIFFLTVRNKQLSVFASWVDDLIIMGLPADVRQIEQDLERSVVVCKSEGEMKEYVEVRSISCVTALG
jgi:hypothetical protein